MEYRYEEKKDMFRLTAYADAGEVYKSSIYIQLDMRPDWLLTVLDVARVAGKFPVIKYQPPKHILWFETDANNNLVRFNNDF